jgi:hypothetical protein
MENIEWNANRGLENTKNGIRNMGDEKKNLA